MTRRAGVGAITAVLLLATPTLASAGPHAPRAEAASAASAGAVYGGTTQYGWPVVVELSKNRKQVARATVALAMQCSAGFFYTPDFYLKLRVSKKGKFGASYGPQTVRNDDGTTTDWQGSISGKFNKARTKVSGKWQLKATDYDTAGTKTDTCDSGSVSWKAKQ